MEEMMPLAIVVIKCLVAILAGILLGNGAVYFFNRMPDNWFVDYDGKDHSKKGSRRDGGPLEIPEGRIPGESSDKDDLEKKLPGFQRIKSYPWKFLFSMFFCAAGIYMAIRDPKSAIFMSLVMWLLLEISIADIKYRIIPDQLVILIAVSALGSFTYHGRWTDCLFGALAGLVILLLIAVVGRLFFKAPAVGGGDVKMFAALGLVTGLEGILIVFVLSTVIAAIHFIIGRLRGRYKKGDTQPMAPYTAVATAVYFILLWGRLDIVW